MIRRATHHRLFNIASYQTCGIVACLVFMQAYGWSAPPAAEPPAPPNPELKKRIVDREPFDRITLDAKNDHAVIEVFSLGAKNRKPPDKVAANSNLRIRLIKSPDLEYDVNWGAIEKIEPFEAILMNEVRKLIANKEFNEAFEYLDRIRRVNPNAEGLSDAMESFLFVNGGALYAQEKYSEALAIWEELYLLNPKFKTGTGTSVVLAIDKGASEIVSRYMEKKDYPQARQMLVRLKNAYGDKQKSAIDKWQRELSQLAAGKRDQAKTLAAAGRFSEALTALKEMLVIWPDVEGGRELAQKVSEQYPLVVVGVSQLATIHDSSRFEDWSARRTGRLVRRRLCEFVGRGPEGGVYESPLGKIESSDDGRQLTLLLDTARIRVGGSSTSGYDVADSLLAMATPGDPLYLPAWASLVAGVSVQNVNRVRIDFRRSHVLPQALLQTLSDFEGTAETAPSGNGPYIVGKPTTGESHFLTNKNYPFTKAGQPREIVERVFDKADRAITALKRGEVDVLDRVFPADIARLKADPNITVGRYTLPTLHMLVPNTDKPYMASRTFRRALLYGIDRSTILNRELLSGAAIPGCTAISGPFPSGLGANDPLAYAYDEHIKPRVYNPRLALTLIRLTEKELEQIAKKKEEPTPELQPLVLGLPPTEAARVACETIVQQLGVIGVKITLKELDAKQIHERQPDCDLTYTELALWEPVVDADRLLGPGGFIPETSSFISLALRRLESASNWKDASETLKDLHRIVYDDVTVIPLWQLSEHFAYRNWLTGFEKNQVQLYQNVEQWRIGLRGTEE